MGLGYICKINCEGVCHYFFMTFRPSFLKECLKGGLYSMLIHEACLLSAEIGDNRLVRGWR